MATSALARRWVATLTTLAFGFLAGCASGPAPVDRYYTIEVANPTASAAQMLEGALHVDRLRTDALAGQRNVLYRKSRDSAEIHQHAYHRWSNPPAISIQTALISYLRKAEAATVVMAANARSRPHYLLSGRMNRFERLIDGGPRILVDLDLSLATSDGEILIHKNYREERVASGTEVASSATEFGVALHAIFERFLADLGQR